MSYKLPQIHSCLPHPRLVHSQNAHGYEDYLVIVCLIVPGRGILLLLEDLRLEHSISISISHSRRCYHAGSHGTATPSGRHSYQGIPQALLKL